MALVVEYHEDLESDLLKQGVDLLDFWRGRITPRRMQLLVNTLPVSSRTFAKADPEMAAQASWTVGEYLQAVHIDMFGVANFKDYKPLTRPGDAQRELAAADRVARFLAEQAERNRAREAAEARAARKPTPTKRRRA